MSGNSNIGDSRTRFYWWLVPPLLILTYATLWWAIRDPLLAAPMSLLIFSVSGLLLTYTFKICGIIWFSIQKTGSAFWLSLINRLDVKLTLAVLGLVFCLPVIYYLLFRNPILGEWELRSGSMLNCDTYIFTRSTFSCGSRHHKADYEVHSAHVTVNAYQGETVHPATFAIIESGNKIEYNGAIYEKVKK